MAPTGCSRSHGAPLCVQRRNNRHPSRPYTDAFHACFFQSATSKRGVRIIHVRRDTTATRRHSSTAAAKCALYVAHATLAGKRTHLLLPGVSQPLPCPLEVLVQLRRAEARVHQLLDLVLLLLDLPLADLVLEDHRGGVNLAPLLSVQGGVVGQVHLRARERKTLSLLIIIFLCTQRSVYCIEGITTVNKQHL